MKVVKKKISPEERLEIDVRAMFLADQIKEVIFLDRTEEMEHIYNANKATVNKHIKECTAHNYRQMRDNPKYCLVITNEKIIARNKYSNRLFVPKKLVDLYNVKNIPITVEKVPLLYNLFELQDFKQT